MPHHPFRFHRRWRSAVLLTAVAAVAGGLGAPASASAPAGKEVPKLEWRACGEGLECATAEIPLAQGERTSTFPLVRIPATDPAHREGSLFVNAGLQAGGGVDLLKQRAKLYSGLAERYDVVGFDLRGQSNNSPSARCMSYEEVREIEEPVKAFPTVKDRPSKVAESRALTSACGKRTDPALLAHMSTAEGADDLDLLRRAVGDDKLNYLGQSYGTLIGQIYAARHPGKVGAMVLDGAVHGSGYVNQPLRFDREQLAASEHALGRFFSWCARTPKECAFGDGDPARAYDKLVAKLERNRVAHPGRHDILTGGALLTQSVGGLISSEAWPEFAALLTKLDKEKVPKAPLATGEDTVTAQQLANSCSDRDIPTRFAAHDRHLRLSAKVSPHFGRVYGYGELKCAVWPVRRDDRFEGPWRYKGAQKALVIGVDGDPLAPLGWAREVTRDMGRARLLSVAGDGHTSFGRGSACVDGAVREYLVSGKLPGKGAWCALPGSQAPGGRS